MAEAQQRPRRIAPRYPIQREVDVSTDDGASRTYAARDVSTGGLFLSADPPLPLFSLVQVRVPLRDGATLSLPARVVHVVSAEKAAATGIPAGIGLQFEPLDGARQAGLLRLVEEARTEDPRARHVRRAAHVATPPEDPVLAFLLSHVEGHTTPERLAQRLALPLEEVEGLLRELAEGGWVLRVTAAGSTDDTPRAPARRPSQTSLRPLPMRLRTAIERRLQSLSGADHYRVLGVPREVDDAGLRDAFARLTTRWGPQHHEGKRDPDSIALLEQVFEPIRAAYAVLGRPDTRRAYDEYLGRNEALEGHEATTERGRARRRQRDTGAAETAAGKLAAADLRRALRGRGDADGDAEGPEPSLVERCFRDAEAAMQAGDAHRALRTVGLLLAMDLLPGERMRAATLRVDLLDRLAFDFERQARYEARQQKWVRAAKSWAKVCEGRPHHAEAHRACAEALLSCGADPRKAGPFARRGVELADEDPRAHAVLGRVLLRAGMREGARRALARAAELGGADAETPQMLGELRSVG